MTEQRLPLVMSGTRSARAKALVLLPPGPCLEQRVHDQIAAGRVRHPREGLTVPVYVAPGVVAVVRRERAPSGRLCWRPIDVITTGGYPTARRPR